MNNSKPAQADKILAYLQKHGKITQLDCYRADEFRDEPILRLSARIFELRERGYDITSEHKTSRKNGTVKQYVEYRLEESA